MYIFGNINLTSSVQRNKQVHLFIVYYFKALPFAAPPYCQVQDEADLKTDHLLPVHKHAVLLCS